MKLARTFVTNFFQGKQKTEKLKGADLDKNVYEPYLCESGVQLDPKYDALVADLGDAIWKDQVLIQAGKAFADLHKNQHEAVKQGASVKKLQNKKGFRNKALTE